MDSYGYDGANRGITAEQRQNGVVKWSQTYGYGAHGNRGVASSTGLGSTPLELEPGAFAAGTNRAAAAQGCMAATINSYSWLLKNGLGEKFTDDTETRQLTYYHPFTTSTTTYAYDGEGRRMKKVSPAGKRTVYVYDAFGNLAAEYSEESRSEAGAASYRRRYRPVTC